MEGARGFRLWLAVFLERMAVGRARRVHCVSRAFREKFQQMYPHLAGRAGRVIHPVLAARPLAIPLDGLPWDCYFVCVRRLVHRTGVDMLLDAFEEFASGQPGEPSIGLVLAGDGSQRAAIEAQIGQMASGGRVRYLGSIEEATKDRLYAGAIANVVPTRALEGFGLVVVEAAMQGCPSIVTDVDGLPEAIRSLEESGEIVEPMVTALADSLRRRIAMGPLNREALREAALQRYCG